MKTKPSAKLCCALVSVRNALDTLAPEIFDSSLRVPDRSNEDVKDNAIDAIAQKELEGTCVFCSSPVHPSSERFAQFKQANAEALRLQSMDMTSLVETMDKEGRGLITTHEEWKALIKSSLSSALGVLAAMQTKSADETKALLKRRAALTTQMTKQAVAQFKTNAKAAKANAKAKRPPAKKGKKAVARQTTQEENSPTKLITVKHEPAAPATVVAPTPASAVVAATATAHAAEPCGATTQHDGGGGE